MAKSLEALLQEQEAQLKDALFAAGWQYYQVDKSFWVWEKVVAEHTLQRLTLQAAVKCERALQKDALKPKNIVATCDYRVFCLEGGGLTVAFAEPPKSRHKPNFRVVYDFTAHKLLDVFMVDEAGKRVEAPAPAAQETPQPWTEVPFTLDSGSPV